MARFDGKTNKQIATKVRIGEISGVDKPAHEGAVVSLFKCETDIVKISFEQALNELNLEDELHEVMRELFTRESALHRSISAIFDDPEEYPDPRASIAETLQSYVASISAVITDSNLKGEEIDDSELEGIERRYGKSSDGKKKRRKLTRKASNNAGVASTTTKQESTMTPEEMQAENTSLKAQLATAIALGTLTDAQKSAYNNMDDAGKESFLGKSASDRDTFIETMKAADPVVYTANDGTEFRKSDGALANMAKRMDEQEKLAKAAQAKLDVVEFAKRADKELQFMPGTAEERGALLKAVDGIEDETMRTAVMTTLKSRNDAMSSSFKTKGTTTGGLSGTEKSAESKLDELAKAHASQHNVTYAAAYEAVMSTPEGESLYNESVGHQV